MLALRMHGEVSSDLRFHFGANRLWRVTDGLAGRINWPDSCEQEECQEYVYGNLREYELDRQNT